jgi:anaerobic glycerol-3-phosphate dehydrogenase
MFLCSKSASKDKMITKSLSQAECSLLTKQIQIPQLNLLNNSMAHI